MTVPDCFLRPVKTGVFMNRKKSLGLFLFIALLVSISLIAPCTAATTELHIVKYASDGTTVIKETTVTWQWMRDNLPVMGDGTTHYYHQGPVFANDAANAAHQEELRWNPAEDTNVQEKDYGAVRGTNLKDLCDLVGGLSQGEEVTLKAVDGLSKNFAYRNVYEYPARQGPMVITWSRDGATPDTSYDEGMKLVFFADTSGNPWGIHALGNYDWHESADSQYWYYYYQGAGNKFPTTTGLSVKYISEISIISKTSASLVQPPVAAFSATPVSGTVPLVVRFTDQSTGSPTSWAWDFTSDGTTDSTQQNPSYTFPAAGTYTVKLTATNSYGSTNETKNGYITVSHPAGTAPIAIFSSTIQSGTTPMTVRFSDQSTGSPTSWAWDFTNDGTPDSTQQNPSYTFTTPGTYTVKLTATNAYGSTSETKIAYITVTPPSGTGPVTLFSASPDTGIVPLTVQFTDHSTGSPASWSWDFNDDGVVDSTTASPSFTYTKEGTYTVILITRNSAGTTSQNSTTIRVTGRKITAGFSEDVTTGTAPLVVQFTDQSTGGIITLRAWDFTNDGVIESIDKNPWYTYTKEGTYSVNLTVSGPNGTGYLMKPQLIHVTKQQGADGTMNGTAAQKTATVTTTPPEISADLPQTTDADFTEEPETPPRSPGPDAGLVVVTLIVCGLGTMPGGIFRHAKR
jgi:PKD repeat protein